MRYDEFICIIKDHLEAVLERVPDHNLDEKYLSDITRNYSEALRALESARVTRRKGEY